MPIAPEEVMLKMLFGGSESPITGLVNLAQMQKAAADVGRSPKDQLGWALKFSSEDLSAPSLGRVIDFQLELAAFRSGFNLGRVPRKSKVKVPVRPGYFPSPDEVKRVHERFNIVLTEYLRAGEISIRNLTPTDFTLTSDHRMVFGIGDSVTGCVVTLMKLISEFPDLVRRCPSDRHGCGHWFLAKRTDAEYCSKTCGTRKRTREKRDREATTRKGAKHAKR